MRNAKRAAALITCIGMILVLFISSAYVVHEAGHACAGEHCEVCVRVEAVKAMLYGFTLLAGAVLSVRAILSFRHVLHVMAGRRLRSQCTLVSWKVRLDD